MTWGEKKNLLSIFTKISFVYLHYAMQASLVLSLFVGIID